MGVSAGRAGIGDGKAVDETAFFDRGGIGKRCVGGGAKRIQG